MDYDPLSEVTDEALRLSAAVLEALSLLGERELFMDLPGVIPGEKERLTGLFMALLNNIRTGIANNPSKLWLMQQFKPILEKVENEDTEGREHFGDHVELIMDILDIESSDGLLSYYL